MKAASVRSLWRWCGLGGLAGAAAVWMAFGCRQADSSAANLPEVKSTVESNTAFAVDLYQRLKDQPGNLFFSPYSLSTALAMASAGARGQTETEMARTLRFSLPSEDLHIGFGKLHDTEGVWIGDASAFPTAPGVNPMVSIMSLAHRTAERVVGA